MNFTINQSKSTNNPITLLKLITISLLLMIADGKNKYELFDFCTLFLQNQFFCKTFIL